MSGETLNILFLGGGKRVSMAEYFISHGCRVFSYELNDEVPVREKATIIIGKKWNECHEHLIDTIRQHEIHIVIPFVDPATILAAQMLTTGIFSPVSEEAVCSTFFSKIAADQWCRSNNIPVPSSDRNRFPLIAKPDQGSASQGIIRISNKQELEQISGTENYLIQEFLDAREYTVDAYRSVSLGNINYVVPRIRLETQGGEAIKARTVRHKAIEALSRTIIEKSNLRGAITLQFLEDRKSGKIYFMEVNPRFGGGVVTTWGAGIDLAAVVKADYHKIHVPEIHDWEEGLIMLRRFSEIYIHANHH